MRSLTWLAAIVLCGLSACAQDTKTQLVRACVDQGQGHSACTCFAGRAEDNLTPPLFEKLLDIAHSADDEQAALAVIADLSLQDQGRIVFQMLRAAEACEMTAFGN